MILRESYAMETVKENSMWTLKKKKEKTFSNHPSET